MTLTSPSPENVAATTIRQLTGIRLGWGEMVAAAQAVLTRADDLPRDEAEGLYLVENAVPLIAAARILDAASDSRSALLDERPSLAMLGVVAYAMHGNFASAVALAERERLLTTGAPFSTTSTLILGICLPNRLGGLLPRVPPNSLERRFMATYAAFLATGDPERAQALRTELVELIVADSDATVFERSLLRLSRLVLEQAVRLSVPRVLRDNSHLSADIRNRLVERDYRVLLPPQYRALIDKRLLLGTGNAMIALPTSTGKTLLGCLCLLSALDETPGLVVYVTPWIAAARQTAETLNRIKPPEARLLRLIGGYDEEATLSPDTHQEIVVATPERLDGLLRSSPQLVPHLRAVVFDEAHLVENAGRGVRLEGIIARLRLMQDRDGAFRLIFISAVMSPDPDVQRWLRVAEEDALIDAWSPTARRLAMWSQDGRLEWYAGHDAVRRRGTDPGDLIGSADLLWPQPGIRPASHFGAIRAQEPLVNENVAYLAHSVIRRLGSPVLCVCSTKAQTRYIAAAVAARLPVREPLPPAVARIRELIDEYYPYLRQLRDVLPHGVAFHNSTVPVQVRHLIEEAVKRRVLDVVAATTTLAEGVDLPFRVTIIADWLLWGNEGKRPMTSTLFQNVAGRAGRAGSFTDGDTILFDNPLGDPIFTHRLRRRVVQREFFLAEALPGLASAFESAETPTRADLSAALASQFLAAIPENPQSEDLGRELLNHMLLSHRPERGARLDTVEELLRDIRAEMEDPVDTFAVASSPLALTSLGRAASRSGFSPRSVKKILSVLRDDPPELTIETVAAHLLRQLADIPEQPSERVRGVLTNRRSRFWIKPNDFEGVIAGWLEGTQPELIFAALPIVSRTTITPSVEEWLSGSLPGPKWDEQYDTFIDFLANVVMGFLPWLFRACETLSVHAEGWADEVMWREWAAELESPPLAGGEAVVEAE